MKKLLLTLTVLLAIICVLPLGAFAAEIVPGLNILTGTEDPMTFDGLTALPSNITDGKLVKSPMPGETGNAVMSTKTGQYALVRFGLGANVPCERDLYISFKVYNDAQEGYQTLRNFWVMKNGASHWQIAWPVGGSVYNGENKWKTIENMVGTFDMLVKDNGDKDTSPTSIVVLEWEHTNAEAYLENQLIYIDDVSIIPAYKVTYIKDGGEIHKESYVLPSNGKLVPEITSVEREAYIIGWSLEKDGEICEEVKLNNKDITLYAVYDNSVHITLSSDINLLGEVGAKTTISAHANSRNPLDDVTFTYSVAEGSDFVTLTDNGDGTAEVVSKAEGVSKIVYTASTGESKDFYILSDYLGTERTVKVLKEAADITADAGESQMIAVLFSSTSGPRNLVWKVSDSNVATVKGSGTSVSLVGFGNGTVTVTVCDSTNEELSESFEAKVSNQREKYAVYDLRVLFWGASVTKHGANAALGWHNNWGMAASSEDKDYVHRLVSRLEEAFYPSKVNFEILANGSRYDADISADTDPSTDYSSHQVFVDLQKTVSNFNPNIIMADNTGNLRSTAQHDCITNAYYQVYDMMYGLVPDAIIYAGYCHLGHNAFIEEAMADIAERYQNKDKIFLANHYQLAGHPEFFAREWLNLNPPQPGVAAHWGDKGMDEVSRVQFNMIESYIRSNIQPTYIYIPESLTISGANKITDKAGSVKLTAVADPDDATNDVIWSIDNEKIAVINNSGVLTAIYNGTVTVTATSKYNDEVVATHKVTITGQPDACTVTYDANTEDEVSGMPQADNYAAGSYVLSENRPLRDCYTFVGWGLTPNATEAVTEINVTENTTVYAIWEKTEGFEFDGDYDEYFAYTYGFNVKGGFHAEIANSMLTAICTGGEKVRFESPKLDIENKGYISFDLLSGYTESGATLELTVYTENDSKTYVFPITTDTMTTYIADISMLSGNVKGFDIYVNAAPADGTMFSIYIDHVRFGVQNVLDASAAEFSVTDGITTVSSATHKSASKVVASSADGDAVVVTLDDGFGVQIQNTSAGDSIYLGTNGAGVNVTVTTLSYDLSGKFTQTQGKVYTESDGFFMENSLVSDVLTSYDRASIRVKDPQGMRVMASVTPEFYTQEDVSEYGFVVTRLDTLESGRIRDLVADEEYLSANLVQKGASYSKQDGKHIIYEVDAEKEIFTAAFINIPESKDAYETKLAFRPYIKLNDGRMIYGAKTARSLCDIAISIAYDPNADKEAKIAAKKIVEICEVIFGDDKEAFVDIGPLWKN